MGDSGVNQGVRESKGDTRQSAFPFPLPLAVGILELSKRSMSDKKNDKYKKYLQRSIVTAMLLFTVIAISCGITSNDVYIFAKYAKIVVIYSLIFSAPLLLYKSVPTSNIFSSRKEFGNFLKYRFGYILTLVSMIVLIFNLQKVLNSKKKNKDNENKTAAYILFSVVLIVNLGLITLLLLPLLSPSTHVKKRAFIFIFFGIINIIVSSIIPTNISNTSHIR
jgi:cell division protein FtsW (lipid II flippase)